MKKKFIFMLVLVIISLFYISFANYNEVENIKQKNLGNEHIELLLTEVNEYDYNFIYSLINKYNITFYYVDVENSFFINEYTIKTNSSIVNYNNEEINIADNCISTYQKQDCEMISKINKDNIVFEYATENILDNGYYYFKGEELTEFAKELGVINTSTGLKINIPIEFEYITYIFTLVFITLFYFILNIKYFLNMKLKHSLLLINGYSKTKIIYETIRKKLLFDILIIFILMFIIILLSKLTYVEYFILALLMLIFLAIDLISIFMIMLMTINGNLISIIKKKKSKKFYATMRYIKVFFLVIVVLLGSLGIGSLVDSSKEYLETNNALNIREDYGQYIGTNIGNDTEEYFFSKGFYDTLLKASSEFLSTVDYFFVQINSYENEKNSSEVLEILTTEKYLDYNKIYGADGNLIAPETLSDDTCYFMIPQKYKEYDINLSGECLTEEYIYIQDEQNTPTYQYKGFLSDSYGMITNSIITIYPKEILESAGYVSADNIYYPVDENGEMVDKELVENSLKKYGIYDNMSNFRSINQEVKYNFLVIKIILMFEFIIIILLLMMTIFFISFIVKEYFEKDILKICLLELEGYSFVKVHRGFFKDICKQILIELFFIIVIGNLMQLKIIYSLFAFLIVYIILCVFFYINIKMMENKSINTFLKGDEI